MPKLPEDPKDHYIRINNAVSLRQLAELYSKRKGCSLNTLKSRSKKEGWPKLRTEFWSEVGSKVDQDLKNSKASEIVKSVEQLDREHLEEVRLLKRVIFAKIDKNIIFEEDGKKIKDVQLGGKELAVLANAVRELHKDERMYSGIEPGKVYIKGSNKEDGVINRLFGDLKHVK